MCQVNEIRAGLILPILLVGMAGAGAAAAAEGGTASFDVAHKGGLVTVEQGGDTLVEEVPARELAGALMEARADGAASVINALTAIPLDPNGTVEDEQRLLGAALDREAYDLANRLLALGANPAYVDTSILRAAAQRAAAAEVVAEMSMSRETMGAAIVDAVALDPVKRVCEAVEFEPAAVNWANDKGVTPLIQAAMQGRAAVVAMLIERGANPNLSGDDGLTPLAAAAMGGDAETIRTLTEAGALTDYAGPGGLRPLLAALSVGATDVAEQLVEAGAAKKRLPWDRMAPGDLAIAKGLNELQGSLALETSKPPTSLAKLIDEGAAKAVQERLDEGADPGQLGPEGWPLLHLAALGNHPSIFETIFEALPDSGIHAEAPHGGNILHTIAYQDSPCGECLAIIYYGMDLYTTWGWHHLMSGRDSRGRTPILAAVLSRNTETAKSLLIAKPLGAWDDWLDSTDESGVTPLLAAVITENAELVYELSTRLKPLSHDEDTPTPQDIAREKGDMEILDALPYDFQLTHAARKGISREEAKILQRQLKDWGYYGGAIDGLLGPGSAAALEAFFLDRQKEIKAMAAAGGPRWTRNEYGNGDAYLPRRYNIDGAGYDRTRRRWIVFEWSESGDRFTGYTQGGQDNHLAANGIGLYEFSSGNSEIKLLGPNAFDDDEVIE